MVAGWEYSAAFCRGVPASALSTPGEAGDRGGEHCESRAQREKRLGHLQPEGKGEDPAGPRSRNAHTHRVSGVDGGAPVEEEPGGGGVAVVGGLEERGVGQWLASSCRPRLSLPREPSWGQGRHWGSCPQGEGRQ